MKNKIPLSTIVKETGKEIYQEVSNASQTVYNNIFKSESGFLRSSFNAFLGVNLLPYAFLPIARKMDNGLIRYTRERYIRHLDAKVTGGIAGAVALYGQFLCYRYAYQNGHKEYLSIFAVTNLASVLYEKARKVKKRLEEESK